MAPARPTGLSSVRAVAGPRAEIEAALNASFSESSGELTRHTTAGYAGVSLDMVTHLRWSDGSGSTNQELVVEDRYLADPTIRDFVQSTNRDLQAGARQLGPEELGRVLTESRDTIEGLLDGVELKPVGLGWWKGTTTGSLDTQLLVVVVGDGRFNSITRSVDAIGSTGSDSWKFAD